MTVETDDIFERWLQAVARLEGRDEVTLSTDSYRRLLLELGHDAADIDRMDAAIEAEIVRGLGYLEYGRLDDAIGELEHAHTLAPWRLDALLGVAEAHTRRWQASKKASDAVAARAYARQALAIDPEVARAFELLNALDDPAKAPAIAGPSAGPMALGKRRFAVAGGVALVSILAALWLFVSGAPAPSTTPPTAVTRPPDLPFAKGPKTLPAGRHPLSVEWVGDGATEGLEIDFAGSTIEREIRWSRSQLKLRLTNPTGRRISRIIARLEFAGPKGEVHQTKIVDLLNSAHPPLREGDQLVWGTASELAPWDTALIRVVVTEAASQGGAGAPISAAPACLKWAVSQPPGLALGVGLRARADREFIGPRFDFEIRNTGSAEITDLRLRVDHHDADGALIEDTGMFPEETVAAAWLPIFRVGEHRLVRNLPRLAKADRARIVESCVVVTHAE